MALNLAFVNFFREARGKRVVLIQDIKDFSPTHHADFDEDKTYEVRWEHFPNDTSFSTQGFYDAKILCLGADLGDIEHEAKSRGLKVPTDIKARSKMELTGRQEQSKQNHSGKTSSRGRNLKKVVDVIPQTSSSQPTARLKRKRKSTLEEQTRDKRTKKIVDMYEGPFSQSIVLPGKGSQVTDSKDVTDLKSNKERLEKEINSNDGDCSPLESRPQLQKSFKANSVASANSLFPRKVRPENAEKTDVTLSFEAQSLDAGIMACPKSSPFKISKYESIHKSKQTKSQVMRRTSPFKVSPAPVSRGNQVATAFIQNIIEDNKLETLPLKAEYGKSNGTNVSSLGKLPQLCLKDNTKKPFFFERGGGDAQDQSSSANLDSNYEILLNQSGIDSDASGGSDVKFQSKTPGQVVEKKSATVIISDQCSSSEESDIKNPVVIPVLKDKVFSKKKSKELKEISTTEVSEDESDAYMSSDAEKNLYYSKILKLESSIRDIMATKNSALNKLSTAEEKIKALEEEISESLSAHSTMKKENTKLLQKISALEGENSRLLRVNLGLSEQLLAKSVPSFVATPSPCQVEQLTRSKPSMSVAKSLLSDFNDAGGQLTKDFGDASDQDWTLKYSSDEEKSAQKRSDEKEQMTDDEQECGTSSSKKRRKEYDASENGVTSNEELSGMILAALSGKTELQTDGVGKVHLGNGVWMSRKVFYDKVAKAKVSPSIALRDTTSNIYQTNHLAQRSLDGGSPVKRVKDGPKKPKKQKMTPAKREALLGVFRAKTQIASGSSDKNYLDLMVEKKGRQILREKMKEAHRQLEKKKKETEASLKQGAETSNASNEKF